MALLILATLGVSCTSGTSKVHGANPTTTEVSTAANTSSKVELKGGCPPFTVYAQNRWDHLGANVRTAPDVGAELIEELPGNTPIKVSGYVVTVPVYPNNKPPYQGGEWFFSVSEEGWVNSAAVRAEPTEPDPTGTAGGGSPVRLQPKCQGTPQG